jgi:hypothetical protein
MRLEVELGNTTIRSVVDFVILFESLHICESPSSQLQHESVVAFGIWHLAFGISHLASHPSRRLLPPSSEVNKPTLGIEPIDDS